MGKDLLENLAPCRTIYSKEGVAFGLPVRGFIIIEKLEFQHACVECASTH